MSVFETWISALTPEVWEKEDEKHVAAIAFGSNLGDRLANIEHALRLLEDPETMILGGETLSSKSSWKTYIVNTSFLYETSPMYVHDQPDFMNGACLVHAKPVILSERGLITDLDRDEPSSCGVTFCSKVYRKDCRTHARHSKWAPSDRFGYHRI
jgi:hypothetical protein